MPSNSKSVQPMGSPKIRQLKEEKKVRVFYLPWSLPAGHKGGLCSGLGISAPVT